MIYGVTGTHRLLTEQERLYVHKVVRRNVLRNRRRNKLVSGCAFGVDTEAVLAVWGLIPFSHLVLVAPGTAQHNWGLVEKAEHAGATVIRSSNLYTAKETLLRRNEVLVERITQRGVLLAFPQKDTFYRSGTWATINNARALNIRTRLYPFAEL